MAELEETHRRSAAGRLPDPWNLLRPAILLPTLAITATEASLYFGYTGLALWGHFLTLLGCVFGPLVLDDDPMLQMFALVPVFRLVNLGMPTFFELTLVWFPFVYAPLFPAIYVVANGDGVPPIPFDLRDAVRWALPAVVLAAILAEIEFAIIRPEALVPAWTFADAALLAVVMVGFVGLVEELVFRGLLQRALEERLGRWTGLLLASGVFGMMHSAYGTPYELLFAAGIGLLFGLIYDATDSILAVTLVHGMLNVFLFGVIPLGGSTLDQVATLV